MCEFVSDYEYSKLFKRRMNKLAEEEEEVQQPELEKVDIQVPNYDNNHSLILLLSKSNFFSYDSLDGGSSRVTGPSSL
jgi:endonuclease III-like uncharacterized protein